MSAVGGWCPLCIMQSDPPPDHSSAYLMALADVVVLGNVPAVIKHFCPRHLGAARGMLSAAAKYAERLALSGGGWGAPHPSVSSELHEAP